MLGYVMLCKVRLGIKADEKRKTLLNVVRRNFLTGFRRKQLNRFVPQISGKKSPQKRVWAAFPFPPNDQKNRQR
jgi:hypothetical protein